MSMLSIILPKVDGIDGALHAQQVIKSNQIGNKSKEKPLWAMFETEKGVVNVEQIASLEAVSALVLWSTQTKSLPPTSISPKLVKV